MTTGIKILKNCGLLGGYECKSDWANYRSIGLIVQIRVTFGGCIWVLCSHTTQIWEEVEKSEKEGVTRKNWEERERKNLKD